MSLHTIRGTMRCFAVGVFIFTGGLDQVTHNVGNDSTGQESPTRIMSSARLVRIYYYGEIRTRKSSLIGSAALPSVLDGMA